MTKVKTRRITEFKAGEKLFSSTGISKLKVTKDDEIEIVEIPICSTGITELMESFRRNAPQPPLSKELVEPDSDMGRSLGLTKKDWVKLPNYADPTYIADKEEHDSDLGMAMMAKGINVKFYDSKGDEVTDPDTIVEILKEQGLSGDHFAQVIEDITNLTKWTQEERERFLG